MKECQYCGMETEDEVCEECDEDQWEMYNES